MKNQTRSRKFTAKSSARLGAYLATGIGASTVAISSSDAAIVQIDIGPTGFNIGGVNAGLGPEGSGGVFSFPVTGAGLFLFSNGQFDIGLAGEYGFRVAVNGGYASPRNFAQNASIDISANFTAFSYQSKFRTSSYGTAYNSPDFGPGSYMGFKTAQGNYGWLEVTWDSKLSQFEILSAAYESTPGTAILAGATGVPEASSSLLALVAGGAALTRRRRQRAA